MFRARTCAELAEPFFWEGGGGTGCVLIHGLGATPQEMRYLGRELHRRGATVSGIRLSGHGTRPEDLIRVSRDHWIEDAVSACEQMAARVRRVFIGGQSLGALLALVAARDFSGEAEGIILFSPAFVIRKSAYQIIAPWLRLAALLGMGGIMLGKRHPEMGDSAALRERVSYPRLPLRAFAELAALQRDARNALVQIWSDHMLVVQSIRDPVSPPGPNQRVIRTFCNALEIETLSLEKSGHVVTADCERHRVASAVSSFMGLSPARA